MVHRNNCFLFTVDPNSTAKSPANRYIDRDTYLSEDSVVGKMHPYAFSAKMQTHTADNPAYKDILRDAAMTKEVKILRDLRSFRMVSRPRGANVLASTWAFKKKCFPDGALKKYKVRFCVRGDQQIEGLDVFETFEPVVAWITVRLLLILSMILQLNTQQVDYTNAFCQAPL